MNGQLQKQLRRGWGIRIAALVVGVLTLAGLAAGRGLALGRESGGVLRVRLGGDAGQTRVVLDLDRGVRGRVVEAGEDLMLSLPGVPAAGVVEGEGRGLVRGWSLDRSGGSARLRLRLNQQVIVARRFLLPPADGVEVYRYVVDLAPASAPAFAPGKSTRAAQAPIPSRPIAPLASDYADAAGEADAIAPVRTERRQRSEKPLIVIDAGHGGKDPGTAGQAEVEKTITLAAARDLRAALERTGRFRVRLTRDRDVYIPLNERVRIARDADADLFISLHADSGSDPAVQGASVYTLSQRGADRAARRVLGGDDWVRDAGIGARDPQVTRILFDLTQRATQNRSAAFARVLLDHVQSETPLLQRSQRDAGFAVLLAPEVPAVLLEMGFLTNPDDEARLRSGRSRARMMAAAAAAVDAYFAGRARRMQLADLR